MKTALQIIDADDIASIASWGWDEANRVKLWTAKTKQLFGLPPDADITYELFTSLLHPEDVRRFEIAWAAALDPEGARRYQLNYRIRRANDGVERWIASSASVEFEGDRACRVSGVLRDITEERQASEAQAHLAQVVNSSVDAIISKSTAGIIVTWNAGAERMFGYTADEMIGQSITQIIPFERRFEESAILTRIISGETVENFETIRVNKDGRRIDVLISISPMRDPTGRISGAAKIVRDITDLKTAERALRASEEHLRRLTEEMEQRVKKEVAAREAAQTRAMHAERLQALGQLAGGVAHDINNVLQGLQGAMQLIERRPTDQESVLRLVRLANGALERGASITGRLLTLGRSGELATEPLEASDLLSSLQEVLTHTLGGGITVRLDVEPALPRILADRPQLETVMVNLATNARDSMPNGGALTIAARQALVVQGDASFPVDLPPGPYVLLQVCDQGTGMDAATLARAREPFFTTKQAGSGTGLGLTMAHDFAEQTGGVLTIDTRCGTGTTVTLWLPVTCAEIEAVAAAAAPAPDGLRHVLVVDDEPLIREVLAEHLRNAGYSVRTARNGAEALQSAGPHKVDAVVCDFAMPGMDGLSVIRALRSQRPGLPAVLLTGYAGNETALTATNPMDGPFALLRKPVSDTELLDRVSALLSANASDAEDLDRG